MSPKEKGKCRSCGADLVDWKRVHKREIRDARNTFKALQYELIRHHFFHSEIDETAIRHAKRKGRIKMDEAVRHRLEKYLAPANPPRDGRQTPFSGNSIFYAQHATATCCRTCLEYWHNIPKGNVLTDEEFAYCFELIQLYLEQRLPDLQDNPVKVPRQSRNVSSNTESSHQ
ncbi:MAG: DUF4186 family protein [Hyphomicrobiales bacterium]|nr:DUF4186 family protein [Hyphomicrobiales bacterium]